jgi:hypothetical protein
MKKKQIIIPRDRIFISDWEILEEEQKLRNLRMCFSEKELKELNKKLKNEKKKKS